MLASNQKRLVEEIQLRIVFLERVIEQKKMALAEAPEGRLKIHSRKSGTRYYRVMGKTGDGIYLPEGELALAVDLAQKSYDKKVLAAARSEWKKLRQMRDYYLNERTTEECFQRLSPNRRALVNPVVLTDEQFTKQWKKKHPPRDDIVINSPYKTLKGDTVRSRAEILIGDRLYSRGLTYQYETTIILEGVAFHPDFTVLNLRRRKTFFWEHLGLLDDPDYLENNLHKLNIFAKNGILIGKNLIITFETRSNPFNTAQIDQLIETFLV